MWAKVTSPTFYIDFKELHPDKSEHVAAWAVAYIVASAEKTGLTLKMNSNDQGKVYLNGKELVKFSETRTLEKEAEDSASNVTLKKGSNVLVLSRRGRTFLPAIVATARDLQRLAEHFDRVFAPHGFDLGIPLPGVSERMPNDFFRTFSRSCIRTSSERSRSISFVASSRFCGVPVRAPQRGAYLRRHS